MRIRRNSDSDGHPLIHDEGVTTMSSTSRKVLKVMSVFTGVESFGILCSMIKMKIIALWLDATGVGLLNIFNSTVETTTFLTGLGIRQSSVRDLAKGCKQGGGALKNIVSIVRSWSIVAALFGAIGLTALSVQLEEIFFNNKGMWWNFAILGGAVLLNALYAGECAVFQASEEFRKLARAGMTGAFSGLVISIPLFYLLGEESVSLSVLVYSLSTVIAAFFLRNRHLDDSRPGLRYLAEGKKMIRLGAWISMAGFFSTLCQLIFLGWLDRNASIAEVGLYGAGITLVVRYTGLVFNSVSLEFYPRVAANISNLRRVGIFLNHEVCLLLLLFTPMMLLFLTFRKWIVLLLYSSEFLQIIPFITWGIALILFRAVSNTMAMCVLAKGEGKIYMFTEGADTLLGLGLSIFFYKIIGLTGLGVALVIWHFTYMCIVGIICKCRYSLTLSPRTMLTVASSLSIAAASIVLIYYLPSGYPEICMTIVSVIYIIIFFRYLRKRRKSRTPVNQERQ